MTTPLNPCWLLLSLVLIMGGVGLVSYVMYQNEKAKREGGRS